MRKTEIDKKVKSKKIGLITVILLLFICVFLILLTKTNFFVVTRDNIIVKNEDGLEGEKVIMASGLIMEENIFMLDTKTMEKNLLLHPYIMEAKVIRRLPNKVIIKTKERKESFIVSYLGSYIYVSNEGIVLDIISKRKEESLPLVSGLKLNSIEKGSILQPENNIDVGKLSEFLFSFREIFTDQKISSINISNNFDMNFRLKSGTKVAFGDLNDVEYKLSFLMEIINNLDKRKDLTKEHIAQGEIDLSSGEEGIFRYDGN